MKFHHLGLGLVFSVGAIEVMAHGLIQTPPSRTWICGETTKPDEIDNGHPEYPECAQAFEINPIAAYNFMAVVTHGLGRSVITPLPENVCGFDGETWKGAETPWDVPMEWPTTPMTAGKQDFVWNITWGPHFDDTHEFRYWITKSTFQFSPTKALGWDDFETEAFCVLNYDDKNPTANPNVTADKAKSLFTTQCQVPQRDGHHVIYAEWGRTPPTYERFHSCVDVAFGTSSAILKPAAKYRPYYRFPFSDKATRDLLGRRPGSKAHQPGPVFEKLSPPSP